MSPRARSLDERAARGEMSAGSQGNRLMSIHSMLGGHGASSSNDNTMLKRQNGEARPSSVPALYHASQVSPRQQEAAPHNPIFRASSQPPGPHEPPQFLPPQQTHEQMFGMGQLSHYSQHQTRPPNGAHLQHPQPGQFQMHNQPNLANTKFPSPNLHEREREREREKEEERRQRDRERFEMNRTPTNRYDMLSRSGSHAHSHSHPLPHHHHHIHHNHSAFTRPKLTIISKKVFEEAKLHPEKKLGRWTYNPTIRLPFKLSVNALLSVHVPRRYIDPEHNSALKKRKVWGTEIYTDDSDLAAVLVHSAANLPPSGDLEVVIRVMPRLLKYKSSMNNGIKSRGWFSKHDGLSVHVEKVSSVSWTQESSGKGFAKRMIDESHYLKNAGKLGQVRTVNWPPQKYQKVAEKAAPEESVGIANIKSDAESVVRETIDEAATQEQPEGEGDETIELSMDDQGTEVESSFVEPQGPLISNVPEILPTELSLSSNDGVQHRSPSVEKNELAEGSSDGVVKKESLEPEMVTEVPVTQTELASESK